MTTTVTQVNSTTSSTQLVAANVARSSVVFSNTDANRLYLLQGSGTASATNFTTYLNEGDVATIDGAEAREAWQGIWTADGAGLVSITQTTTTALAGAGTTPILTLLQGVATRIGMEVPSAVYSSTAREHVELKELTNEVAQMIGRAYTWRKLKVQATYTGDGTTEEYDLPEDYGWMGDSEHIWSSQTKFPLLKIIDEDQWLGVDVQSVTTANNCWIMFGGQIHFKPALSSAITARHFYQSTAIVQPASGTAKAAFTLDTDYFRLDEQLLKLGVIYRWKQDKGLPYAEHFADYELLKDKLITRDKGSRVLVTGGARWPRGVNQAYPLSVPGGT